ncbi:MAG: RRXRR domain-containing protein, partial [Erysipelotrichaceae bacterium]|nr:RRXRR domain-containing protein [Erysipelotrichaceae bacterium]
MFVYVISKDGQALMPTKRFGKVRRLLNSNKAKVVRRCPFTIKLLYEPETVVVQEVVLGQDTGSKHVGTACAANGEVLYQSQVELRTDIKTKTDGRRQARRFRRNRKTRYRKVRFLNRKNSTKLNRLPPSVKHKVQAHIDEIESC